MVNLTDWAKWATVARASVTVSGCPLDVNGDGVIDFGDYLEFLNLYDSSDARAELNGEGSSTSPTTWSS